MHDGWEKFKEGDKKLNEKIKHGWEKFEKGDKKLNQKIKHGFENFGHEVKEEFKPQHDHHDKDHKKKKHHANKTLAASKNASV